MIGKQHIHEWIECYLLRPLRSRYRRLMRLIGWGVYVNPQSFAAHNALVKGTTWRIELAEEQLEKLNWNDRWLMGYKISSCAEKPSPLPSTRFNIRWIDGDNIKTITRPDPAYPDGINLDQSSGQRPACRVILSYPAIGRGSHFGFCELCGNSFMVLANGAVDDPRSVTVACELVRKHHQRQS